MRRTKLKKINKMHDNDYLASLTCLWKNLVKLKFLVWFSWLVRHVLSSKSDPEEGPGRPDPPILRPNWGPKGRKQIFVETGLLPSYLRVWMTAPAPLFLIWKSASATELHLRRPKLQIRVWFVSWKVRRLRQALANRDMDVYLTVH